MKIRPVVYEFRLKMGRNSMRPVVGCLTVQGVTNCLVKRMALSRAWLLRCSLPSRLAPSQSWWSNCAVCRESSAGDVSGLHWARSRAQSFNKRGASQSRDLADARGSRVSDPKQPIGEKVAPVTAVSCALLALPAFGLFIWLWMERKLPDRRGPSVQALVAFLGAGAIVIYTTSQPQPPLFEATPNEL